MKTLFILGMSTLIVVGGICLIILATMTTLNL